MKRVRWLRTYWVEVSFGTAIVSLAISDGCISYGYHQFHARERAIIITLAVSR
jgi:hypothetical protein